MSIADLDQKILWGKAAGRCSMPDCRKELVIKSKETEGRTDIIFGEMCHIVGEKENAARGKSSMAEEERNRYHNLILLCANHHTIIDKAPDEWPIERLHKIKADHEQRIESRLDESPVDLALELYAQIVNVITDGLQLHRWGRISDLALRGMLPMWFVEGAEQVKRRLFTVNWPGKNPALEIVITAVANRLSEMLDHFLSNAELDPSGKMFREIKHYRESGERYEATGDYKHYQIHEQQKKAYDLFLRRHQIAIMNLTVALNEFAEEVRRDLKPTYFYYEGKFVVNDELGVCNGGVPASYAPAGYEALPQQ